MRWILAASIVLGFSALSALLVALWCESPRVDAGLALGVVSATQAKVFQSLTIAVGGAYAVAFLFLTTAAHVILTPKPKDPAA